MKRRLFSFMLSLLCWGILSGGTSIVYGENSIIIDGDSSDWETITALREDANETVVDEDVDIMALYAVNNDDYLYLRFNVYGNIVRINNTYIIYLDADQSHNTGFTYGWWTTGAEYRIYIDEWNMGMQKFMGVTQDEDLWGWNDTIYAIKEIDIAFSGGMLECAVPRIDIGESTLMTDGINFLCRALPQDDSIPYYNETPLSYFLENDTILDLKFDENAGETVYDSSYNANNGTIFGAEWTEGIINSALNFAGTDYIEIPDAPCLNPVPGITIEAWINIPDYQYEYMDIITKFNADVAGSYLLTISPNGNVYFSAEYPWSYLVSNQIIPLNRWVYIAAVFDGINKYLYLNGAIDNQNMGGCLISHNTPVLIGARFDHGMTSHNFTGMIDEVKIYNYPLTAEEIMATYNAALCPTVTDLRGRGKPLKAFLVWTHVGADSYNVYRKIEGEEYSLLANTTSTYSTYLDTTVATNTTYYYIVKSVYKGLEGNASNEVNIPTSRRYRSILIIL